MPVPESQTILVNRFQFVHVQDNNTGQVVLREGPLRLQLESHQQLVEGIHNKVRVADGEFAVILNPYNAEKGDIVEGEREVRIGPCVFALHPGEELERGKVQSEFVLDDSTALLLDAVKDVPHPALEGETLRSGMEFLLKGPRRYIPHKDIRVKEVRKSISLAESEGVYVQNNDNGVVRLVPGPTDFFLEHNESLWSKYLTAEELQALGYEVQAIEKVDRQVRALSSTPRRRKNEADAVMISLEDNEALYLYDGDRVRVVFGPKTVFLEPNERPKVLFISAGVPLKPNGLRIAKLSLGPDFIRDQVVVRTRDNATLNLEVSYRWRFHVYPERPDKLFALKDFVGFVAQTLSAEIRAEAARHDFERFHAEAAQLITGALFGEVKEREFAENGLVIFGIDVESITPDDKEIANQLSSAILTNVEIYTQTVREKAALTRERELIENRALNEDSRRRLLELEAANERQRLLAEAQRNGEAKIALARAEAEAIRVRAEAELQAEERRLRMITSILESAGGSAYIALEQARILRATDKVIVPTGSRIYLNTNGKTFTGEA